MVCYRCMLRGLECCVHMNMTGLCTTIEAASCKMVAFAGQQKQQQQPSP
jgi:hypothetical protein